jgi:integrase
VLKQAKTSDGRRPTRPRGKHKVPPRAARSPRVGGLGSLVNHLRGNDFEYRRNDLLSVRSLTLEPHEFSLTRAAPPDDPATRQTVLRIGSDNSLVVSKRGQNIVKNCRGGRPAPTTVNSSVRTREYLTTAEIERLMAAARKSSRYGHRDATMILIGYRHGLRASELCDLQWSQVELTTGRLHVRRAKNGSPSVHPMQGEEIRALRRLQRDHGLSSHVFMTERDGPMTPNAFHALFGRIGSRAKMQFPIHPHMLRHGCGYALANAGHDTRALQAWLGHKNIQHTVRYTELAPDRFKNFWR